MIEPEFIESESLTAESDVPPRPPSFTSCYRCHGPLGDARYLVTIDADPPLSAPIQLGLCEPCMMSMTRWASRRRAAGSPDDLLAFLEGHLGSSGEPSGHRSKRGRHTPFAAELDRNTTAIRAGEWLTIAAGCVLALIVLTVFLYSIFRS